jgi:hypothetical protein
MYFLTTRNLTVPPPLHCTSPSCTGAIPVIPKVIPHMRIPIVSNISVTQVPWYSQHIQHPSNASCSVGVTATCDSQRKFTDRSTYCSHPSVYDAGRLDPQTKPQFRQGSEYCFDSMPPRGRWFACRSRQARSQKPSLTGR